MATSGRRSSFVPWSTSAGSGTALVCVPWAGAGANPFRAWARVIDDAAAVYGVRLPGRESRQSEPLPTALGTVVAELVSELGALGVPRVALFGQCSGALLAFEVAKALRREGTGPNVVHLLVASQLPPRAFAGLHVGSEQDLVRYVPGDLREEPELLEVLLPILAADMKLVSAYAYRPDERLDVPITVLYGALDEDLGRSEVDGWRHETTGATEFREIAGADHLFDGPSWLELAKAVRAAMR